MRKFILMVILLVIPLATVCTQVHAAVASQVIMKNQISDAEMDILSNAEFYSEEDAEILKTIDFSKATIVVAHMGTLMELGELPLEKAIEAGQKNYYIAMQGLWYCIIITEKEGSYECTLWEVTKTDHWGNRKKMNQAVVSVAKGAFRSDEICGKTRDVLDMYVFIESGMDALVSVTTEGTFVRFYTGNYAEDGNTEIYVDMPMEVYRAWVAAFSDFQAEYRTTTYTEYGDLNINTLGDLVCKYGITDEYYLDMELIHLQKQRGDLWFKITVTAGVFVLAATIAGLFWIRHANRKKYGY